MRVLLRLLALELPTFADPEQTRRARMVVLVVRAMLFMGALGMTSALLDSRNVLHVTVLFYAPVFVVILALARVVRAGHVALAGWALSLSFWACIAFVSVSFGGLFGGFAGMFGVSILLIGTLVGGRAALAAAIVSSVWCAGVGWLEYHQRLPPPLGPYSPLNAWTALTLTFILTSVLLRNSLDSLRDLHARAERAAAERDEALRRSIEAQKMEVVGNLSSGIAHDFNNLLSVIGGSSESLRAVVPATEAEAVWSLDNLDAAVARATLMNRQLLSFGRRRDGEAEPVDLSAVVRSFAQMLPRLLGSTIREATTIADGCVVLASRAGLEQVILNLAVNARDAMPKGGVLTIDLSHLGDRVVLRVADSGVGMDGATLARAFEPFFTTKSAGTGLGLATVHSLVTRFGGTITPESTPGAGTSFTIRLPCAAGAVVPVAPPDPQSRPAVVGGRVLVVDDDALVRRTTGKLLEQAGYEVVCVADAEEALALVGAGRAFAAIVTDLSMPGLDGEQLADRVAALQSDLAIVLFSGDRVPSASFLAKPRRAFLEKPVGREALLQAIRRAQA